jgi:hypothetical protein
MQPKIRETITFEKTIAPGVRVRIEGVPATIQGNARVRTFDPGTGYRLEHFLLAARERMAHGETEIRYDFSDTRSIAKRRTASPST